MFGLSSNHNLDFFIGKDLQQICIGNQHLILNFFESISISIESEIGIIQNARVDASEILYDKLQDAASALVKFLSFPVVGVSFGNENVLELSFANDGRIKIYDDNEHYESYQIKNGKDPLIVV